MPNDEQFDSEEEIEETIASPREPKRLNKSLDKSKDSSSSTESKEKEERPKGPLHPLDEDMQKLYQRRVCFSKLEDGACDPGICVPDSEHNFNMEDIFLYYKIIRFRDHENLLPKPFKAE